jgi:acylphosphatase
LGRLLDDLMPMARRARSRGNGESRRFLKRQPPRSSPLQERWRLMVDGDVQGVGFRSSCCRRATELGLSGWVRNLSNGRVEVQAEGNPMTLNELRLWCERGPSAANVRTVRLSHLPITGDDWFEVRP